MFKLRQPTVLLAIALVVILAAGAVVQRLPKVPEEWPTPADFRYQIAGEWLIIDQDPFRVMGIRVNAINAVVVHPAGFDTGGSPHATINIQVGSRTSRIDCKDFATAEKIAELIVQFDVDPGKAKP